MDFSVPIEREVFREEVSTFLEEQLGDLLDRPMNEDWLHSLDFCRAMSERGWVGSWWPHKFGGQDLPYWYQLVLMEELAFWEAPRDPLYIGWDRVAWSLLTLGSEEQQTKYLPPIRNVDHFWCQAFTEPDSGSDLASLRTRAMKVDNGFILTGQKAFNSFAANATHALVAVRTDSDAPKHAGISLLIVDMSLPGVTVRPLGDLRGSTRDFNEIFFDEVEVPFSDLLGPENGGWNALRTTLNAERSGVAISRLGYCRRALSALERCWESLPTRIRASSRSTEALAELRIQVEVLRLLSYRVAWEQEAGILSNVRSSGAKLFGGELQQKLYESIFALWPEAMQLMPGSSEALLGGFVADHLLESTSATIAGGTSEILRTLIARRGLGLTA